MNELIQELAKDHFVQDEHTEFGWQECRKYVFEPEELVKFAELIVRECKENFSKVWYEQGMDIRGAEIGKFLTRFDEHFGVDEQDSACPNCGEDGGTQCGSINCGY